MALRDSVFAFQTAYRLVLKNARKKSVLRPFLHKNSVETLAFLLDSSSILLNVAVESSKETT